LDTAYRTFALGEFSWPFADALQRTAVTLLSSSGLSGDPIEPLMHVVAEAETYQIVPEPQQVPAASSRRPFIVVAFPRSLKHHALLHLIFGHELGHSAFQMQATMQTLYGSVVPALQTASPMANPTAANAWLLDSAAPADVKASLAKYHSEGGESFEITDDNISDWHEELTCDLFGLILFGPPFVARIGLIWNRFVLIPIQFI
jgi:hypothetical protein